MRKIGIWVKSVALLWLAYRLRAVTKRVWAAIINAPVGPGVGVEPAGAEASFGGAWAQQAFAAQTHPGADDSSPFGMPLAGSGVQAPPDVAAGGAPGGVTPAFAAFQNFAYGGTNGPPGLQQMPTGAARARGDVPEWFCRQRGWREKPSEFWTHLRGIILRLTCGGPLDFGTRYMR